MTLATRERKLAGCRLVPAITLLGWLVCLPASLWGQTDALRDPASNATATVDFATEIFPLLQRSCLECHGADKQEGGLRLDSAEALAESGAVVPGNAGASELMRRVRLPAGDAGIMPAVGQPLSAPQIELLARWIRAGASWPADFRPARHWSYVPPVRPQIPVIDDPGLARNPIDHFVLARLEQEGLTPAPLAAPGQRLRRLYLDLLGVPPTPAEVEAFARDPSPEQYRKIVDELLSRRQFGERWARPWLDLARYADSHGFQRDNLRDLWAYRDWVIRAINDDLPFDQFTIEQLAGDLLPHPTEAQRIATGFHRCAPTNVEAGSLPEETRFEQVVDRVNTTGAVWLGTTLECCQCHDHKYDPFSMVEYYQLLAYFNNTEREADRTNPKEASSIQFRGPYMDLSDPERDRKRHEREQQLNGLRAVVEQRQRQLEDDLESWVDQLRQQLAHRPQMHLLEVQAFESQGATDTHRVLEDGAILLEGGDPPDTDLYTIRVTGTIEQLRALRLDVLRHPALPGEGPGRGDPVRRNFVLHRFQAHLLRGGKMQELEFVGAQASFSQKNWEVGGALKPGARNGWAVSPQFDQSHWAQFELSQPLDLGPDDVLEIRLEQNFGQARTIGCLRLSGVTGQLEAEAVPESVLQLVDQDGKKWKPAQRKVLLEYRQQQDPEIADANKRIAQLQREIETLAPDTTLVMIEQPTPRATHVAERGDYRHPGQQVQPGTPQALHPLAPGLPPNRLGLARWLVDPRNPLVARVVVNRWWAEMFGQGLVGTPEDFGIKGDRPTHPLLLDWLAVELIEGGWSRKKLIRTIVLSRTYQQDSRVTPELLQRDPRNLLLARGPRFRMSAEMIRDTALSIAGRLNLKSYGPPIRPYQPEGIWSKVGGTAYKYEVSPGDEAHRRGIYVVLKRGSPYPSFLNFDATNRLTCTVQRSRTNTPLQALTLLNDPVYVEAAQGLAQRIVSDCPDLDWDQQLDYGFLLCTARRPTRREREVLQELFQRQTESGTVEDAWFGVATALLNLHQTVTKD